MKHEQELRAIRQMIIVKIYEFEKEFGINPTEHIKELKTHLRTIEYILDDRESMFK